MLVLWYNICELFVKRMEQGTYVGGGHQHGRWRHGTRASASASARQRLLNSCPASLLLTLTLSSTSGTIHQTSNGVAFLGYHFHIRTADVYHRDSSACRQGWKRSSTFSSRRRLSHSGDPIDCTAFGIPLILILIQLNSLNSHHLPTPVCSFRVLRLLPSHWLR